MRALPLHLRSSDTLCWKPVVCKRARACDTRLMTFSLPVFPLRQKSECLLSLEAYSEEQKKRICWCLAENITKQQHPASAPTENKVSDPSGSSKTPLRASWGSACGGGFALAMLLPGELLRRLFFCQVRREFVFRHCCAYSFLPCSGKQLLRLRPLTGVEAGSSEQPASDTSQHLYLDS